MRTLGARLVEQKEVPALGSGMSSFDGADPSVPVPLSVAVAMSQPDLGRLTQAGPTSCIPSRLST